MESNQVLVFLFLFFFSAALITFTSAQDHEWPSLSLKPNEVIRAVTQKPPKNEQKPKMDPKIQKICATTDYVNVCIRAVTPYLNGKTDPASVSVMAIKAAMAATKSAIAAATKAASSAPHNIAKILEDCIENYKDAIDNFKSALRALPAKDIGTANSMLSAAITDYSDSTDQLHGQNQQLVDLNEKLSQMTSNCLAIVSLIKK